MGGFSQLGDAVSSSCMISQTGWSTVPGTDMWVIGAVPLEVPGALWMRELVMCLFFFLLPDILLFPDEKKRTFELPPSSEAPDVLALHVP